MKRKILFFTLYALLSVACKAQQSPPGYNIIFEIEEIDEPVLYLGFYYKGRTYLSDTAQIENKKRFVFKNDSSTLNTGFYFLLNEEKSLLFEFVVGNDQHFSLELTKTTESQSTKVVGDIDNAIFFQTVRASATSYTKARPYLKIAADSTKSEEDRAQAQEKLATLEAELQEIRKEIAKKHPNLVVSKFIRSNQEPELPAFAGPEHKLADPLFRLHYYRAHFFDNMPLNDPLCMRLPPVSRDPVVDRISNKLDAYLDNLFLQQGDSLIGAVDALVKQAAGAEEIFTHLVWLCTVKYQEPKIMGLDKVLVHIYDTYYATGRMDSWANQKLKDEIKKVADRRRLSLIGGLAPDLKMQDAQLNPRSLYDMQHKYRVVYFFNPDCHGCALETPKLREKTAESAFDIGVFAVCTDTSMQKLKDYVKKMEIQDWTVVSGPRSYVGSYQKKYDAFSTPTLILIDRQNRIIAKKIPSEGIENFLKGHEILSKKQKK